MKKCVPFNKAHFFFPKVVLNKPLNSISAMMLFFIGLLEMVIVTVWTKAVTRTKVLASSVITMINIMVWYYVLERIVSDIGNWKLVLLYALGCTCGVAISTAYFQWKEKQEASALAALEPEVG